MGLSALPAIQFWNRFLLFFQEPSRYSDTVFNRYMDKSRVHLYTLIQIFFFGCVFFVQNFPPISIAFPFMTLLCIPGRLSFLPKVFEGWELLLLDGDDLDIAEWEEKKLASLHALKFDKEDLEAADENDSGDDES